MRRVVTFSVAGVLVVTGFAAIGAASDRNEAELMVAGAQSTELLGSTASAPGEQLARASASTAAPANEPPVTEPAASGDACPSTSHGAVIDRANQMAWLCVDGAVQVTFPITSAISQPDPGTYDVYAKDMQTTSSFGNGDSTLDRFVAFTNGKYTGARIAFHAIPRFADGTLAQSIESVGAPEHFGDSAGCIRVRPDDAVMIWDFLSIGDEVRVVS